MGYVLEFWKNIFNTKGRISRKNFFITLILIVAINHLLSHIANLIGNKEFILFVLLYTYISVFPNLTMTIRRLHDMNESAWNIIILFIPFVNIVFYIYILCAKGVDEGNRYGNINKIDLKN